MTVRLDFSGFSGTVVLESSSVLYCVKCRRPIGKRHKCYRYYGYRYVCQRCHGRNFRRRNKLYLARTA